MHDMKAVIAGDDYRGLDELIGVRTGTDGEGDRHGLGGRRTCRDPFGPLGEER